MKRMIMSVLFAIGILGLTYGQQSSKSNDADWVKIGQTTINLSEDYGVFDWDRDREETINANDKYSAIKFKAKDSKVNLSKIEVEYDNGKKENLSMPSAIDPKTESKQLKLDTREDLDKITFSYIKDESAASDDAVIEIWGLKEDASGMGQRDRDVDVDVDTDLDRDRDKDTDVDVKIDRDRKRDKDRNDVDVKIDRERDLNKNRDKTDIDIDVDTTRVRK